MEHSAVEVVELKSGPITEVVTSAEASRVFNASSPQVLRIASVDCLRGGLVLVAAVVLLLPSAIREWSDSPAAEGLVAMLQPSLWEGITIYSLVNPGFLFVTGISAALSVVRRRQQHQAVSQILAHLAVRSIWLFLLGLAVEGSLFSFRGPIRIWGSFQQIAMGGFIAGVITLIGSWRISLLTAVSIVVIHGLSFDLFPPPQMTDNERGVIPISVYSAEHNFAARVDQAYLPGEKYFKTWDPQGLWTTLPAVALSLFGAATALVAIRYPGREQPPVSRGMVAAMALLLINAGFLLSDSQPAIAWLLTPTFAAVELGTMLLAVVVLADADRLEQRWRGINFTCQLGRNCLGLMVALHLVSQFGVWLVPWIGQQVGMRVVYVETIVAIAGLLVLCWWNLLMVYLKRDRHQVAIV